MTVIDRIASLQFDPLEVAGRNHDLVLLARIAGYRREWTDALLYDERALFEAYNKGLSILPASELPYHRITWDRSRVRHDGAAFDEHAPLVEELLERIRTNGPLGPGDVGPRAAIDWYWRPTNQVRALLEALAEAGILGLARRDGNRRVYDLAERLFPEELLAERHEPRDQFRHKLLSRYRGHGLLGTSGSAELWLGTSPRVGAAYGLEGNLSFGAVGRGELLAELIESGDLLPVEIEGIRGRRFIVRGELPMLTAAEAEVAGGADPGGVGPGVAFFPGRETPLGLLRPADPLRRSARRSVRAADRSQGGHAQDRRDLVGGRLRSPRRRSLHARPGRRHRGASPVRRCSRGDPPANGAAATDRRAAARTPGRAGALIRRQRTVRPLVDQVPQLPARSRAWIRKW